MFLFSCYLTGSQIEIPPPEMKVNNFFQGDTGVSGGRHYSASNCESKCNMPI